ncbi:hypothetical protein DPMN_131768 [Dreissena polymorpha]|uniref:Uncharacterized protein n=1 Tax=Dreissena polymorpha TaxID=45954 RepID=A0A9D4FSK0_DREPO|nr:hypothetical protein DPMN_131768 [Dreissena polymorpha]
MVPVLLSILVLAMHHPADVFVNQMKIAEYAISLIPNGSHIHIGIFAYKYFELFDESKEKYENQMLQLLYNSNYTLYISASSVTLQYIHNFKIPPGLPQIGLILGSESRVTGDMTGIKRLKKKTFVVVDITSPSKGLADLATSPDHVFSPFAFDANRFSNLLNNDAQLLCDTDMYLPSSANGSCQPCMNPCGAMLPLNCTTRDIQRQCKYYEKKQ